MITFERIGFGHPGREVRRSMLAVLAAEVATLALGGCMVSPQPLEPADIAASAQASLDAASAHQEPVKGTIDLAEAMARAVLYNLDNRVALLEATLRSEKIRSEGLSALPEVAARAGYTGRNVVDASYSKDIFTDKPSLQTSTSQDLDQFTRNLAVSWNVLDLGLSYVRAKQAADRALIAQEQRRRIMARVIEEVRVAYWRALAAEYLGREMRVLEGEVREALKQAQRLAAEGQTPPLVALSYQREVYEIMDRLQSVEAEVAAARNQLAALMNLAPGTQFKLVRPAGTALPSVKGNARDLVKEAISQRAEVREMLYEQRIGDLDGTKALLELLPGISLDGGPNFTSNSYTWANNWVGWGARASWNLMKLAWYPVTKAELDADANLREERLKATVATVALQVHVSRVRYGLAQRRADTLGQFTAVQARLLDRLKASATSAQMASESEVVREKLSALLARARHDVAVADAQAAYAGILTTLGRDPYPTFETTSLKDVANAFRRSGVRAPAMGGV